MLGTRFSQLAFDLLTISALLAFSPPSLLAGDDQVITLSGKKISSIFEGLTPSQFVLDYVRHRRGKGRGQEKWLLDGWGTDLNLGARYHPVCAECPSDTKCADHYQVFHDSSGCIIRTGRVPCRSRTLLQTLKTVHTAKAPTIVIAASIVARMHKNAQMINTLRFRCCADMRGTLNEAI
jgi:hypothetical protein